MSTDKKERRFDIISGPNRSTLFNACEYACDENSYIAVDFVIARGYTAPKNDPGCAYIPMVITNIKITKIGHKMGSGKDLYLDGHGDADLDSIGGGNVTYRPYEFWALYNARVRKGDFFIK